LTGRKIILFTTVSDSDRQRERLLGVFKKNVLLSIVYPSV
jgi:hypothetical protein